MLHGLGFQLGDAALDRMTLFVNHLLTAEPVAGRRLAAQVGRTVELRLAGWPAPLPPVGPAVFRVTPAGLFERADTPAVDEPDLRVEIDASNPALAAVQALVGQRPRIEIAGDAAFAADLNWLFDNLRWDVEDDLARVVGPVPAREVSRIGRAVASALRDAARTVGGVVGRR